MHVWMDGLTDGRRDGWMHEWMHLKQSLARYSRFFLSFNIQQSFCSFKYQNCKHASIFPDYAYIYFFMYDYVCACVHVHVCVEVERARITVTFRFHFIILFFRQNLTIQRWLVQNLQSFSCFCLHSTRTIGMSDMLDLTLFIGEDRHSVESTEFNLNYNSITVTTQNCKEHYSFCELTNKIYHCLNNLSRSYHFYYQNNCKHIKYLNIWIQTRELLGDYQVVNFSS